MTRQDRWSNALAEFQRRRGWGCEAPGADDCDCTPCRDADWRVNGPAVLANIIDVARKEAA